MTERRRLAVALGLVVLVVAGAAAARAEQPEAELTGRALVEALRAGGYNLYFRHAPTDWSSNDQVERAGDWLSCDPAKMRQLSDAGRASARRLGASIRALGVPVGKVLSSEYCRAAETARLMDLGAVTKTRAVMNTRAAALVGGMDAVVRRAREVLLTPPEAGTNTVIVGHGNLMRAATGAYAQEGGAGVYAPRAEGAGDGPVLVARLSPEDWQRLAREFGKGVEGD